LSGTPGTVSGTPGLILDRDGVINLDTGYLYRIGDCRFVPGIFDLVRDFSARGFRIAVATNQSGIGRGYFAEADFRLLMDWMDGQFRREAGVGFDAVYHCPDHPTEGLGAYRRENSWRKPGPGMFLQAIKDLGLDPARSWTIGDKPTDMAAAAAAGIAHRVLLDETAVEVRVVGTTHWVVPRLADVPPLLETSLSRHPRA
jgi:D-glycero-D-manno-heptose 1,7-bisphosphate phosphatase